MSAHKKTGEASVSPVSPLVQLVLHPVMDRRLARIFFEGNVEVIGVGDADHLADLRSRIIRMQQKLLGLLKPLDA
ncbi:hypothetical protein D3C73_1468510 [compost metagenome]